MSSKIQVSTKPAQLREFTATVNQDELMIFHGLNAAEMMIGAWANRKKWDIPSALEPAQAEQMLSKLALVHSEISEATEAAREKEPDLHHFVEELADAVIRILHITSGLQVSLGEALVLKMRVNENRPIKHGKVL